MDTNLALEIGEELSLSFGEQAFLRKLGIDGREVQRLLHLVDWETVLEPVFPLERRLTCREVAEMCRPMLDGAAPEPAEGWTAYAYKVACSILYPRADEDHTSAQWDAAMCYLKVLQVLLDEERREIPFDPRYDFSFCTESELQKSFIAREYRQFLSRFREEYVYEMLRLGREVTPFRTLDHIAGVHYVAMTVARAFAAGGGLIDLALMSGAAAAHDIGKFGCRPGERVPYLHYYYTDQWCSLRELHSIGHIAANHSVWDLEIENLSAESLILVYADFRVKQDRDAQGHEIARIYSLDDAFDVILSKLDNVDAAKKLRYQFVYAKLHDFEEYLMSFGVDTTLATSGCAPRKARDAALLTPPQVVTELRRTAVDHNIRLMYRLSHDQLFASVLEAAHSEKDWGRVRAYVSIFEEYFTYLSGPQKEQTLEYLYELLLSSDGDIRRQSSVLMGLILARFQSGYKKELPVGAHPDPEDDRPFRLWAEYLEKLIRPDRRLTPAQTSKIRYTSKLVVDALLESCSPADAPRFMAELLRQFRHPEDMDGLTAFALLDTAVGLPASHCDTATVDTLMDFAVYWLRTGQTTQKAAAMRLFLRLLGLREKDEALRHQISLEAQAVDCEGCVPLLFLQVQLGRELGFDTAEQEQILADPAMVSNVFLNNLKSATHWVLKSVGVQYLLDQVERGINHNVLLIATHFSNLMKVSEHVVVRRQAGMSLLAVIPHLTPDQRNEIAVELSKALETGQFEQSRYIPEYLGQVALWLTPQELDELISLMETLLSSPSSSVVAAALSAVGSMLEHYQTYGPRFREREAVLEKRRRLLIGLLLKGLSSYREPVHQESLAILGKGLFASKVLTAEEKESLFTLVAKKFLCLIREGEQQELTFFYTASALSDIYRFIVAHKVNAGDFRFTVPEKVAFFPGTFDPFSLSHKGIVQNIRDLGFEVYLAIDEFSWSKKAQPGLIRRQLVSMSIADEFDVYLFPHDIPVNLATPEDLQYLQQVFAGRELYLAVGSDVVANASSYRTDPVPGSVQYLNHIVFRRATAESDGTGVDLSCIRGKVLELHLPTHLEDISSTRIRENIDLGRDISNLIDPSVQDYIYRNSLYLREPQYKKLVEVGALDFTYAARPDDALREEVEEFLARHVSRPVRPDPRDSLMLMRSRSEPHPIIGVLAMRIVNSVGLYPALGNAEQADYIRNHSAGRICLITGLSFSTQYARHYDLPQLLLTDALFHALSDDCSYAVYAPPEDAPRELEDVMRRSGFLPIPQELGRRTLMLTDMRSPVAVIQNIPTTLKEPFASHPNVLAAVYRANLRFQRAVSDLYPGTLVLSLNAEIIYHRLVRKITEINGVPAEPTHPRVLGPKMCAPFGKILRGNAIPNTVTKTIHTDKVFAPDLKSFTIQEFPGYAPLDSQIRTIHSFRRPVILVDDLLHPAIRLKALTPLLQKYDVPIDRVLTGLMSGRGRDLVEDHGLKADCVYFIPNLRSWFTESTMYPFIGGDTVSGVAPSVPGLTPAVNLILPYAFPSFYKECSREAVLRFSRTCIENSRDILAVLESVYREKYARILTLSRLSEAVILPLSPDKGSCLSYDPNLPASKCLEHDLLTLVRMRQVLE
ncbi:nicotinate-nicotinamide nucleotide adenylyltransferase [Dysosmobacter sp.]|uniref:nicotinate-nicotinamide nucleotide adenylyltransferase n=1 Tax=Dysosmobacter sp. TaxID=2591382 RepID=UPI002A88DA98|nr:cytidyltransferase-related domain protein [Dysosmobacter sp.]MDY3281915.1 cytidyltransferase-related domain protein [Dysosmobacter sp.]